MIDELTDAERELLPSDEDVEFYAEHGWYLTKKTNETPLLAPGTT